MAMLRSIFGPSKDEIWSQVARDIGGEFIDSGFWGRDALIYKHGEWQIRQDTYTTSSSREPESSTTYTRMRAPFVNKDGLYFQIYREGFFSSIGKVFGMQNIEIGDPFFDEQLIVKGNNAEKIRLLLADTSIKELVQQQPNILIEIRHENIIEIRNEEGWFRPVFPEGVDELYFETVGVIKETRLLRSLFELFSAILERLVQIDSAYENDPNVQLR